MDKSFGFIENMSDDEDSEESGWTSYFDDFFAKQRKEQYSGGRISHESCLVSDAASCVVIDQKKLSESGRLIPSTSTLTKLSKTLDIKKRKNKENLYDDSLEDTASSPVNSPKIMQVGGDPNLGLDGKSDEKTGGMAMEGEKNDCEAVKNPGLCLFSMSMTGNYFG